MATAVRIRIRSTPVEWPRHVLGRSDPAPQGARAGPRAGRACTSARPTCAACTTSSARSSTTAIDEALAGLLRHHHGRRSTPTARCRCSTTAAASRSTCIPPRRSPRLELVLTELHAGGKFGGGGYKVSGGLHGVGASVVNALSERLVAEVLQGRQHLPAEVQPRRARRAHGGGRQDRRGTAPSSACWPDPSLRRRRVLAGTRRQPLREVRVPQQGRHASARDEERDGHEYTFYFEGGIQAFVRYLNANRTVVNVQADVRRARDRGQRRRDRPPVPEQRLHRARARLRQQHPHRGGRRAPHRLPHRAHRTLNKYARKAGILKEKDPNLSGDDVRDGLTAVISVKLQEPQFEGQTKTKLGNSEVAGQVSTVLSDALMQYLDENPADGRRIIDQSLTAARARQAAAKARDLVRRKSFLEGRRRCPASSPTAPRRTRRSARSSSSRADSAGGSAKQGRERKNQAILPLRGKILNVEKARADKILGNEQIKDLITALGVGFGENFSIDKLALPPHRAHGRRRRRRLAHPHPAAHLLLAAHAAAHRRRLPLPRAAAAVQAREGQGSQRRPSTRSATTSATSRSRRWAGRSRCRATRVLAR